MIDPIVTQKNQRGQSFTSWVALIDSTEAGPPNLDRDPQHQVYTIITRPERPEWFPVVT